MRMGENGAVGLEPYYDSHLSKYQQDNAEQFESLDLERGSVLSEILKEKR